MASELILRLRVARSVVVTVDEEVRTSIKIESWFPTVLSRRENLLIVDSDFSLESAVDDTCRRTASA